jgi:chromosome segregation ATPase
VPVDLGKGVVGSDMNSSEQNYLNEENDILLPQAESEGEGIQPYSDQDGNTSGDEKYNEYIQLLLQEIEDIEHEIRRKSNREGLEKQQEILTKKLDEIEVEEPVNEDQVVDIKDQISLLKYQETLYQQKIKKLDHGLNDYEIKPNEKYKNNEVIMQSVSDALSFRQKINQEDRFTQEIKELESEANGKQKEVDEKFTSLQKLKQDIDELNSKYGIHKLDSDNHIDATQQDVERLEQRNLEAKENEKPEGIMNIISS